MRKKTVTHPQIIRDYGTKPLAFFYMVKSVFKNSVVYGCNKTEISRRTGVSYYLASKYLNSLIKDGVVEVRDGNYVFKSMFKLSNNLYKKGYREIGTNESRNFKRLELELQSILIAENISTQRYNIQKRLDVTLLYEADWKSRKRFGDKAEGALRSLDKVRNVFKSEKDFKDIVITDRNIAKLLCVSQSKANIVLNHLRNIGYLRTVEIKGKISYCKEITPEANTGRSGYLYMYRGAMYKHIGSKVVWYKGEDLGIESY
jgi:Fic family protein